MSFMNAAIAAHRAAINNLSAAAEKSASSWTAPRAPGKWSPSQVMEHVARALEESANLVAGSPTKFPTLPSFIRPIVRVLFFKRTIKKGRFPRARTSKPFDPEFGLPTPAEACKRLESAADKFERACAASGKNVESGVFGTVSVGEYVKFQELHARRHCTQLPGAR